MVEIQKLLDPVLFTELIFIGLLVPAFVMHLIVRIKPKKNEKKNAKQVMRAVLSFILLSVGFVSVVEFFGWRLMARFMHLSTMFPFVVKVRSVDVSAPLPRRFHRYNPSLLPINNGEHLLVAMRESTFQNCPSEFYRLRISSQNRVHLGISSSRRDSFSLCHSFERKEINPGSGHQGFEDGRLFQLGSTVVGDDIITHVGISLTSSNSMFVTDFNVTVSEEGGCIISDLKDPVPVHLSDSPATEKQKNWMPIPPANPNDSVENPLFIQKVNPLTVVSVDMKTGVADIVHRDYENPCIPPDLRGNTNLLRHPKDSHRMIGIAHKLFTNSSVVPIRHYLDVLIEIEQRDGLFVVTGVSDYFRLPYDEKRQVAHRIHFPLSMQYTDKTKQEIDISMGDMDCTAHIVTVKTDQLFGLVKPLIC